MKIGVILVTVVATLSVLIAGCAAPETAQAKGTLQIMLTDAPPEEEVTSIMVTVESVAVHKAVSEHEKGQEQGQEQNQEQEQQQTTTASTDEEAGWIPLDILKGEETFDLLKIKGIEEVLVVTELEAGKYTQIRMTIDNIQVKLDDGDLQNAIIPSGKLKFTHPFDIVEGQTTTLLFDFDAEKSVNVTGSDNIIFKPVIKLS